MSAVERIQAAIDKLTALKVATCPDQKVTRWEEFNGTPSYVVDNGYRFRGMENNLDFGSDKDAAELHVTLHRTIDPLLEAFRGAVRYMEATGDEAHDLLVAIADAILEADS